MLETPTNHRDERLLIMYRLFHCLCLCLCLCICVCVCLCLCLCLCPGQLIKVETATTHRGVRHVGARSARVHSSGRSAGAFATEPTLQHLLLSPTTEFATGPNQRSQHWPGLTNHPLSLRITSTKTCHGVKSLTALSGEEPN